jgi:hypothetical protein
MSPSCWPAVTAAALVVAGLVAPTAQSSTAVNPHPVNPQISWTSTRHLQSGTGCHRTYLYTVRLTGSMEYLNEHIQTYPGSHYAGKQAVVELYGPDYPTHPRETKVIGRRGTFKVLYRAHTCRNGRAGIALVSVDGYTGTHPSPAETVGAGP